MRHRLAPTRGYVWLFAAGLILIAGCDYVRLLRPSVLKQLNPDVVRLVNTLPAVDNPNEAIVGRLFAHGGLSNAKLGKDGVFRDKIWVPDNEFIWKPAIIRIPRGGELELEFHNADHNLHAAFVPSTNGRQALMLPMHTAGRVRIKLDQPGLYWFGCPISNHAGRGMLGLVMVGGEVPPEAKLDRPKQRRPGDE
jgi:PQQ system protein